MQIIFATTDGNEKIVGKYIKKKNKTKSVGTYLILKKKLLKLF